MDAARSLFAGGQHALPKVREDAISRPLVLPRELHVTEIVPKGLMVAKLVPCQPTAMRQPRGVMVRAPKNARPLQERLGIKWLIIPHDGLAVVFVVVARLALTARAARIADPVGNV
jgi:hypothetical protein